MLTKCSEDTKGENKKIDTFNDVQNKNFFSSKYTIMKVKKPYNSTFPLLDIYLREICEHR